MFPTSSGGDLSKLVGSDSSLSPEPVEGDSLTQGSRSLSNYSGQAGKDSYKSGIGTTDAGVQALHPVMSYFAKLLTGDKAALASAMQPQVDQIAGQYGQIRQMFSQTGSRGGGTTSTLASSPYDEQRTLDDATSQARANAASAEGNLGLGEAGIGLNEAGLGANLLNSTQQALLARRGQNFQVDTANREMLTNGLKSLI